MSRLFVTHSAIARGAAKVGVEPTAPDMRAGHNGGGFMADISSAAQSKRGKANRGKTPWRSGPICPTFKAHKQYAKFKTDKR